MGFTDGPDFDRHGRPRLVNLQTVSEYYSHDILAADAVFQSETARMMPLFPFQRIILQEMMLRTFLFIQIMRGGAKSSTCGRGFLDYALMVPNTPIVLTAPTYRQSLFVFDEIVKLIEMNIRNENSIFPLKPELVGEIKRGTMEAVIKFRNGSKIVAVPMGNGAKIRGLRGGILFVDEAYQITEEAYESHLRPFVGVEQGGRPSKIIMATTSWYQDTFAYRRLMQIASEVKRKNPIYGILDFTLEDLDTCICDHGSGIHDKHRGACRRCDCKTFNGFPLSPDIWKDAQRHGNPVTYLMTYYNIWPASQGRWYEQKPIEDALSSKHGVRVELKRPDQDQSTYVATVDLAASEVGDSYEILVYKLVDGCAHVVYGKKAKGYGGHRRAWEAHQVIDNFRPKYMIYDAHGAIGKDFRMDMALDTLIVQNDDKTKSTVESVTPAIHFNENNKRGDRVLIPVSVKSEEVIFALTGVKDGFLDGEAGLLSLLHHKTRDFLWNGKFKAPGIDAIGELDETEAQSKLYSNSEQEALDTVREAFTQLGKISLDKDEQGNQKQTVSGQLVFKKKSGASVDDGAYCLVYGAIGLLMEQGYSKPTSRAVPSRSVPMRLENPLTAHPDEPMQFQKITFC